MANTVSWKQRFADLYIKVTQTEPLEDSQVDNVLMEFQQMYWDATDKPKAKMQCSVCGSSNSQHLEFVLKTGRCVV